MPRNIDNAKLLHRYQVADERVMAALEARDDAIDNLIEAYGKDGDIDAAIEALIEADSNYFHSLDRWNPLYDKLKARGLPVPTYRDTNAQSKNKAN